MVYGLDTKDAIAHFTIDPNTGLATPIATTADGQAAAAAPVASSRAHLFNGTAWDKQRSNTEGTLLASAARTATTTSPVQTNHNARGVILHLDITAVSGTGGLIVQLLAIDPLTGVGYLLWTNPATLTAIAHKLYIIYPANGLASGDIATAANGPLPRTFAARVFYVDGSSYTFSLSYSLIV